LVNEISLLLRNISVYLHHLQGANKLCQLKLCTIKMIKYNTAICRYGKIVFLSFQYFIPSADTTCKLPEDGVSTPKHVGAILILILYCLHVHLLV